MKQTCLTAAIVALAATLALADEIQLTNGRKITGNVTKKDASKVTVEVGAGTITLDAKDVSSISPGKTALNEYDERWSAVKDSKKASDLYDLAIWAKSKGLTRHVAPLCTQVLAIDPDHAGAHAELRHEKVAGKWLSYEQAQEARGLVQMDDRWVTKAEIQMMAPPARIGSAAARRSARRGRPPPKRTTRRPMPRCRSWTDTSTRRASRSPRTSVPIPGRPTCAAATTTSMDGSITAGATTASTGAV
jgi:hypothetical protein